VTIHTENIANYNDASVRDQFDAYSHWEINTHGVPYDYESIMQYGKNVCMDSVHVDTLSSLLVVITKILCKFSL